MTNLDLGRRTLLKAILLSACNRKSEGLVRALVCFELVTLLEAHFEVVYALRSLVLLNCLFINFGETTFP